MSLSRRQWLAALTLGLGGCAIPTKEPPLEEPMETEGPPVEIGRYSDSGELVEVVTVPKLVKNAAAWQQQLTSRAYDVTRKAGTEPPFSELYAEAKSGVFRCVCCDTALFDAATKFDSGTGWPSFWQPIDPRNVHSELDTSWGMRRREVLCSRCDAHLGHVFKDGPPPTYLRYCMNGAALRFAAA